MSRAAGFAPFGTETGSIAATGTEVLALGTLAPGLSLWLSHLDRESTGACNTLSSLSAQEHARAKRFGTVLLRERWIAGRTTLRTLLGNMLDIEPGAIRLRRGIRGRPELEGEYGIDFNVSHTGDTALIAIASGIQDGTRIGIDIEREDRAVNADGLARKFLTERERAGIASMDSDERRRTFLQLWTCKEAMSKATGDALSAPFRHIDVTLDDGPRLVAGPAPYTPAEWQLVAAAVPAGFIATLAIWQRV
jgi:4'-phosphopantetheinyl transferase